MNNPNIKSNDYSRTLYKKISYFLTIIVTEVIIFYMFINFLSSEGIDYRLFLLILPIIAFFILRGNHKITNFVKFHTIRLLEHLDEQFLLRHR